MLTPVILFVYNRVDCAEATLDALAANASAARSDLFVFSDGPKDGRDAERVAAVRKLLRAVSGFQSVTVIERPRNMGLAASIIAGVSEVISKRERAIVLEDDIVTSHLFLDYMNEALITYQNDPSVLSVTGYTYPSEYLHIPPRYPYDTFAAYRFSSWSWGTWHDRWALVDWGMGYFPTLQSDAIERDKMNRGGPDLADMLGLQHAGKIDSWAIRFCYAHAIRDMHCIYPVRTMARNIGFGEEGTHCRHADPRFMHPTLDETWLPERFCPGHLIDPQIAAEFRSIFSRNP